MKEYLYVEKGNHRLEHNLIYHTEHYGDCAIGVLSTSAFAGEPVFRFSDSGLSMTIKALRKTIDALDIITVHDAIVYSNKDRLIELNETLKQLENHE